MTLCAPPPRAGSFRALLTEVGSASTGDEAICLAAGARLLGLGADLTVVQRVDLSRSFVRAGIPATHEHLPLEGPLGDVATAAELARALAAHRPAAHRRLRSLLDRTDVVFVAPGGKLTDGLDVPRALACAAVAVSAGVKVVVLHQSVGPLEAPGHRRLLLDVLSRCELVLAREACSLAFLGELGIPAERLVATADATLGEDWGRPPEPDIDLGLNLRASPLGHVDLGAVRHFLGRCARERPGRRVLLFSTSTPLPEALRAVAAEHDCEVLGDMPGYPDVLSVVGRCRIHVSDSFHGVLFAMLAGRPVVPCQTDGATWKLQGLGASGGPDLTVLPGLADPGGADEVLAAVERVEREPGPVLQTQRRLLERDRERVEQGWARVAALLPSRVAAPTVESRPRGPRGLRPRGAEMVVAIETPREEGALVRWSARLHPPAGEPRELWFTVPARARPWLTDRADPFVIAALYPACESGEAPVLRVEGAEASASLPGRLRELQRIWRSWWGLAPCDVLAATTPDGCREGGGAIAGFSGGIDSAFSLFHHVRRGGRLHGELEAATMVHGFDVPLEEVDGFRRAAERAGRMTGSLGLDLIVAATNARQLQRDWRLGHGAALAAVLTLFRGRFATGVIAASGTYEPPVHPWGSTPLTDGLLGSRGFEIVHDGAAWGRLEKVRVLAGWPEALAHARFCWQNDPPDGNCGRCAKCVLTALELECAGAEPTCFARPPTMDDVASVLEGYRSDPFGDVCFREVLAEATRQGREDPWVDMIRRALATP